MMERPDPAMNLPTGCGRSHGSCSAARHSCTHQQELDASCVLQTLQVAREVHLTGLEGLYMPELNCGSDPVL